MKPIGDDIDLLKFVGTQQSQYIEPTKTFLERLKQRFANGDVVQGEKLPWEKTHDLVGLREGEVSLWAGVNGHGKSLVLGQVILWLPPDVKILIASLEMKPEATLARMVRQTLGQPNPSDEYLQQFTEHTENIYLYDQVDTIPAEKILGMIYYAAQELGVKHFMIDSLMKCGIGPDDYSRQKEFIDRLCWVAKSKNIHIHLVHHIRKGDKEGHIPDKFDIKGAGEITDLVDNIFIVHRNKNKEAAIEHNSRVNDSSKHKPVNKMEPDQIIKVDKQRHGEWEGKINLYFHKPSTQFVSGPDGYAMRWP